MHYSELKKAVQKAAKEKGMSLSKEVTSELVDMLFSILRTNLVQGYSVTIEHFGRFESRKFKSNLKGGMECWKIAFVPQQDMKNTINGKSKKKEEKD